MTDNKAGRWLSNTIWGSDPDYKDKSQSRHAVHAIWHEGAYKATGNPGDRSQADKHWKGYNSAVNEKHEKIVQAYMNMGMTRQQANDKCFDDSLTSNLP